MRQEVAVGKLAVNDHPTQGARNQLGGFRRANGTGYGFTGKHGANGSG